jgi:hypothetical protein
MRSNLLLSLVLLPVILLPVGCGTANSQTTLSAIADQVDGGDVDAAEQTLLGLHEKNRAILRS